jgi:hypothetical protein
MEYPNTISPTSPRRKHPPASQVAVSAQLDLFCDVAEEAHPTTTPRPAVAELLADHIRQRLAYSSARRRQGVVHRAAMPPSEIRALCAELRTRSQRGDSKATLTLLGLLVGIAPSRTPGIPLESGSTTAVSLDPRRAWIRIDYAHVFMGGAADVPGNETALPATHVLVKPLPVFLAQIVTATYARNPDAKTVGDLFGSDAPDGNEPLDCNIHGRLRATAARLCSGLAALILDLGIDRYDAALVSGDMSLIPRSRFFYVRSDAERFVAACRRTFAELGWGECSPLDTVLPFGSQVVPTRASVQAVHQRFGEQLEASRPGRRRELEALIVHHNQFMIAAAWFLSFVIGSREMRRMDLFADRCWPAMTLMEYGDKRSGPFRRLQPVLLCTQAQRQVTAVWNHLTHLSALVSKLGVNPAAPWLKQLDAALHQRAVPLLFLIRREKSLPLATAHCQLGVDRTIRLAPNAGRHFWQTTLLDCGVSSEAIDVWARHANGGTEPMTSTSIASVDTIRQQVCRVQDQVLGEMGLAAFQGLGRARQQ